MTTENATPLDAARCEIIYDSTSLRGLAILAVLVIHVIVSIPAGLYPNHQGFLYTVVLLESACHFAVPVFFTLSLFSLCLKPVKPGKVWMFYRTKLPNLIVPYLVYSSLYIGLDLFQGHAPRSWTEGIDDLAFGTTYYHLWFLVTLLLLFVLHPFAWRFYRRYLAGRPALVAALGIVQIGLTLSVARSSVLKSPEWGPWTILGHPILRCWWYLFAGYLVFDHADRIVAVCRQRLGRLLVILTTVAAFGGVVVCSLYLGGRPTPGDRPWPPAFPQIVQPIFGAAVLLLLLGLPGWTKGRLGGVLKSFGLYSLGIYLVHPAIKLVIERLLISAVNPLYLVVCALLLPLTTLIVVKLLAKSPIGRLLT